LFCYANLQKEIALKNSLGKFVEKKIQSLQFRLLWFLPAGKCKTKMGKIDESENLK